MSDVISPRVGLRVLVVDDSAAIREPLRAILEEEGYRVATADSGQAAIEALRKSEREGDRFAAVLTDLEMPQISGREVAAAAKRVTPPVPVILLSGRGPQLNKKDAALSDVDRVLGKPPKLAELRQALSEVVTVRV